MKHFRLIPVALLAAISFSACKTCYECDNGSYITNVCNETKKSAERDAKVYESNGFTCVKK